MKTVIKKIYLIIPGVLISLLIAILAQIIDKNLPIHFIGASVIALFLGISIRALNLVDKRFELGIRFTSKKVLRFAIVLLGATLNVQIVLSVGKLSLWVMVFTLITCFGGGYLLGKWLKIDWKLSSLISAGTGICGGSAIAAIAPVIEADEADISYAISTTFIFDLLMVLIFPLLGQMLNLTDIAYGLWTGTAINDTSSVVAAGYAFSDAAGDFAAMVKLTRTLTIIPTVLIFSFIHTAVNTSKDGKVKTSWQWTKSIPWFILGFLALSIVNSLGLFESSTVTNIKISSKFLMVMALAAIGLSTDIRKLKQSGWRPLLHGFIISTLVVVVALLVEWQMGLI